MRISVTLPSLHPRALDRSLRNVLGASRGDLEVAVVSPMRPPVIDPRVRWVRECDPRGPNAAHALAFAEVTGDLVLGWVDDHLLLDGWDEIVKREFLARESNNTLLYGLRQFDPFSRVGTVFGLYYPYFPCMRASAARAIGWFDGAYKRGFADCDLAMRVLDAGGVAEWSDVPLVIRHEDDERKGDAVSCAEGDMELFLERWKLKYGHGWRTDTLRDFNRDVKLRKFGEAAE
jgi:hypothetical protein